MLNLCFLSSVSFISSHFLFHSHEYFNITNRFCFLGGRFYLLSFNSSFFMSVCCFFILYFISHSAFWKHRVSFWLIFLSFCNASVSCMIYAIQTHKQQGKLCLAAFGCLRSYIQHLVDVSWPDLFSSGAARGGVGVVSCSSGLPSRWAFCFGEAVFCIHLFAGSFHISYVACLCLLICNVAIHTQVEIPPSPPSLGELSLHSWLSLMFSVYKVLALSSHLFWMLLTPGAKGLSQLVLLLFWELLLFQSFVLQLGASEKIILLFSGSLLSVSMLLS